MTKQEFIHRAVIAMCADRMVFGYSPNEASRDMVDRAKTLANVVEREVGGFERS